MAPYTAMSWEPFPIATKFGGLISQESKNEDKEDEKTVTNPVYLKSFPEKGYYILFFQLTIA